jgi:hypothetical protein
MIDEYEVLHVLAVGAGVEAKFLEILGNDQRYRWLRAQHWSSGLLAVVAEPKDSIKLGCDCPSLERLDKFIDSAIAARAALVSKR